MELTPSQLVELMMSRAARLDEAQAALEKCLDHEADTEKTYRERKGVCWATVEGRTGEERLDLVNAAVAEERHARDLAVGRSKAAMERVRNYRQQLSMLQSASNSIREEAGLAHYGPALTP